MLQSLRADGALGADGDLLGTSVTDAALVGTGEEVDVATDVVVFMVVEVVFFAPRKECNRFVCVRL